MSGDEVFLRRDREPEVVVDPLPDLDRHYRSDFAGVRRAARPGSSRWSPWEAMKVALSTIPDMSEAECKGMHPLFDWPHFAQGDQEPNESYRLLPHNAHFFFLSALRTCAMCPLRGLDGPCVRYQLTNDPSYSGVAGGEVFRDGRLIPAPTRIEDAS